MSQGKTKKNKSRRNAYLNVSKKSSQAPDFRTVSVNKMNQRNKKKKEKKFKQRNAYLNKPYFRASKRGFKISCKPFIKGFKNKKNSDVSQNNRLNRVIRIIR